MDLRTEVPMSLLLPLVSAMTMLPAIDPPRGFLAESTPKGGPGVIVLHPWWGINDDVKSYCRNLAKEGFTVFAPDLFEGKVAKTPEEAEALVNQYEANHEALEKQVAQATQWLSGPPERSISVVGFSFGAYYALHLSNEDPVRVKKVVVYYGTGQEDFSKSKAAYLGHFAEKDPYEPKENVEILGKLLKEANRPATLHTYPGTGHWFAESGVKAAYDRDSADLAWGRTVVFLKGG